MTTDNSTQSEKLEPCPWCAVVPAIQTVTYEDEMDEGRYRFFVECGNGTCPMGLVSTGGPRATETEAVRVWNSRASVVVPEGDAVAPDIHDWLKRDCLRLIYGECTIARCVKRGGWTDGPCDPAIATCEAYEISNALAAPADALHLSSELDRVLSLLISYGAIHTVEGVTYPDGTHAEALRAAGQIRDRLRGRAQQCPTSEQDAQQATFEYCPACAGELDTGFECLKCGADWRSYAIVDEVQRRMDQVVEAAVEWHQAGREGGEWFDAAEKLSATINSLLELRDTPSSPVSATPVPPECPDCGAHVVALSGFECAAHCGWVAIDQPAATPTPVEQERMPINMILFCPRCGTQHVDAPESEETFQNRMQAFGLVAEPQDRFPSRWTNPPHRSHLCHNCYAVWRPADVPTNGVAQITTRGKEDNTWTNSAAVPVSPSVREAAEVEEFVNATIEAHVGFQHETPFHECDYAVCVKRRAMIEKMDHRSSVSAAGGDEDKGKVEQTIDRWRSQLTQDSFVSDEDAEDLTLRLLAGK